MSDLLTPRQMYKMVTVHGILVDNDPPDSKEEAMGWAKSIGVLVDELVAEDCKHAQGLKKKEGKKQ